MPSALRCKKLDVGCPLTPNSLATSSQKVSRQQLLTTDHSSSVLSFTTTMNRLGISSLLPQSSPRQSLSLPLKNGPTTFLRTMARKRKSGPQGDPRVRMIRYFLYHPARNTPRPLKFGTMRMLRHWTIHRAWQLFMRQQRVSREQELERQYNKIRDACEELAKTDERLYRIAIAKKGVQTFPIEMRIPTDTPTRTGWNHSWKRG